MVCYIPKISYRRAGLKRPRKIDAYDYPEALYPADVLIFCWSNLSAAILNHVFFSHFSSYLEDQFSWQYEWRHYGEHQHLPISSQIKEKDPLCYFRLAEVGDKKVLLLKPNLQFACEETAEEFLAFIGSVFEDVSPSQCFSIDSLTSVRSSDQLGDIIFTNSATCLFSEELRKNRLNGLEVKAENNLAIKELYHFSKHFISLDSSLDTIDDLAHRMHRRIEEIKNPSMLPRQPRPLFFSRMDAPLLAPDHLHFIERGELYEEFAAVCDSNSAAVLHQAEKMGIEGSVIGPICIPYIFSSLGEKDRAFLAAELSSHVSHSSFANVARLLLKVLSEKSLSYSL